MNNDGIGSNAQKKTPNGKTNGGFCGQTGLPSC